MSFLQESSVPALRRPRYSSWVWSNMNASDDDDDDCGDDCDDDDDNDDYHDDYYAMEEDPMKVNRLDDNQYDKNNGNNDYECSHEGELNRHCFNDEAKLDSNRLPGSKVTSALSSSSSSLTLSPNSTVVIPPWFLWMQDTAADPLQYSSNAKTLLVKHNDNDHDDHDHDHAFDFTPVRSYARRHHHHHHQHQQQQQQQQHRPQQRHDWHFDRSTYVANAVFSRDVSFPQIYHHHQHQHHQPQSPSKRLCSHHHNDHQRCDGAVVNASFYFDLDEGDDYHHDDDGDNDAGSRMDDDERDVQHDCIIANNNDNTELDYDDLVPRDDSDDEYNDDITCKNVGNYLYEDDHDDDDDEEPIANVDIDAFFREGDDEYDDVFLSEDMVENHSLRTASSSSSTSAMEWPAYLFFESCFCIFLPFQSWLVPMGGRSARTTTMTTTTTTTTGHEMDKIDDRMSEESTLDDEDRDMDSTCTHTQQEMSRTTSKRDGSSPEGLFSSERIDLYSAAAAASTSTCEKKKPLLLPLTRLPRNGLFDSAELAPPPNSRTFLSNHVEEIDSALLLYSTYDPPLHVAVTPRQYGLCPLGYQETVLFA